MQRRSSEKQTHSLKNDGNRLVTDMIDFNQRVIEKFANFKERRATFLYK